MTTHLIIPDAHAHKDHNNDRADWLSNLIKAVEPDVVINIGDTWDMPSLSSYDKGTKSFQGRSYQKDLEAGLEFNERLWEPLKRRKKKLPRRVFIEGNHENRIKRAIEIQPELEGEKFGLSFNDLDLDRYYTDVVEYTGNTPGIIEIDGITYSHYFISGLLGRPIGGDHHAHSLLSKLGKSATCGHSHTFDYSTRSRVDGSRMNGLVTGCYQDYNSGWAGHANNLWWRGISVKENVNNGMYDLHQVSLNTIKKEWKT